MQKLTSEIDERIVGDMIAIATAIIAVATFIVAAVTLFYAVLHSHRIVREDLKYSYFPSPALRMALSRCQRRIWRYPHCMEVLSPEGWTEKEIREVTNLILKDDMIETLAGLEVFSSLESLTIEGISSRDICFHGYKKLRILCIADTSIETIRIERCPSLTTIVFGECSSLLKMRIFGNEALEAVVINEKVAQIFAAGESVVSQQESIDAAIKAGDWLFYRGKTVSLPNSDPRASRVLPLLEMVLFKGNGIAPSKAPRDNTQTSTLNVSTLDSLVSLQCSDSSLTSLLGLRDKARLEIVKCKCNSFESINIANCEKLREFGCHGNSREISLSFSECSSLKEVWIYNSQIADGALCFTECPSLEKVWCQGCGLKTLDFCPSGRLRYLNCANNRLPRTHPCDLKVASNLETLIMYGQSPVDALSVSRYDQLNGIINRLPSLVTLEVDLATGADIDDMTLGAQWLVKEGVVQAASRASVRICKMSE